MLRLNWYSVQCTFKIYVRSVCTAVNIVCAEHVGSTFSIIL